MYVRFTVDAFDDAELERLQTLDVSGARSLYLASRCSFISFEGWIPRIAEAFKRLTEVLGEVARLSRLTSSTPQAYDEPPSLHFSNMRALGQSAQNLSACSSGECTWHVSNGVQLSISDVKTNADKRNAGALRARSWSLAIGVVKLVTKVYVAIDVVPRF